jgi:sec-independent protein translocase protein TatA
MPNIGPGELILVLVIVLIIFGPGKLPDIGNAIGRGVREFRKASTDLEDTIRGESKPAPPSSEASASEASPATPPSSGSSTPESK